MKAKVDQLLARYGPETVTQVLRPLISDERAQRIEAVLDARLVGLSAAIENLHDPHNGAAAIRSVEAIGLSTFHVVETVEHFQVSAAVSIGAEKWIDVVRYKGFPAFAEAMHERGFKLYAACPSAEHDIETVSIEHPSVVVFGNEHAGLSDDAIARCDHRLAIPMHGFSQSFNLSVSVAVAMHRLATRRREALGRAGDVDEPKRAFLRARWYALGMRGVDAILARYVS